MSKTIVLREWFSKTLNAKIRLVRIDDENRPLGPDYDTQVCEIVPNTFAEQEHWTSLIPLTGADSTFASLAFFDLIELLKDRVSGEDNKEIARLQRWTKIQADTIESQGRKLSAIEDMVGRNYHY